MREILFRGKRIDDYVNDKSIDYTETGAGEWVYGDIIHRRYYKNKDVIVIRTEDSGFDNYSDYEVDPETVGQYTGLTDKNGKKIFEGDIIKATDSVPEYNLMVVRNEGFGCFNDYYFGGEKHYTEQIRNADWYLHYKIIGNIHDNFELLEVKK